MMALVVMFALAVVAALIWLTCLVRHAPREPKDERWG
jgi:hypothetical protein